MSGFEHGRSNGSGPAPDWEGWERHLVGSADLARLIDELSTENPATPTPLPSVREVLGEHIGEVLDHGLAGLPAEVIETFARHPALLRDLQGLIFTAGGDYWERQIERSAAELPPEYKAMIERTWNNLRDRFVQE